MNGGNYSVAVVDSGGANINSVLFALERLGVQAKLTDNPEEIQSAKHVILPGVGSALNAMKRLRAKRLDAVIPELKQPMLGICLGMQLLFEASDENGRFEKAEACKRRVDCLGIIPGSASLISSESGVTVPHMGWNRFEIVREHPVLTGLIGAPYAYFVHSYALPVSVNTLGVTSHGDSFTSVVAKSNFVGVQFHPERSAGVGSTILANFLAL